MKRFIVLLLALLLVSTTAFAADGIVSWEGGAEKFVFLPGSEHSESDLFGNFKNVMPGDEIEQIVRVENSTGKKVRIYMRAEGATEEERDFLNQIHLNVTSRRSDIFDAQADETAQLTKNTLLGTFKTNGSTDLTVTLTVPIDLGNEYMNNIGIVPWTFLVEEVPEEEDTPQTGDWFRPTVWLTAVVILAGAVVVLGMFYRKKNNETK